MKVTFANEQFAVFDDVLAPDAVEQFWAFSQRQPYESVHARGRTGVFRLDDGEPLWSRASVAWPSVALDGMVPPDLDLERAQLRFYPTGDAIDTVLEAVKARCPLVADLIGVEGQCWAGILCRPYLYPRGAGVSWHEDSGPYSGAFIYYTHPEWNVRWGGELLVAVADPTLNGPNQGVSNRFDNHKENEELLRAGMGRFVLPKPNRLVFIAPGYRHAINKVTATAGDHMRASLAGFFVTPAGVASLVQQFIERGE
jgi:hypothetical protein